MDNWVEKECPRCEGRKIVVGPCHVVQGFGNTNMHRCPECNASGKKVEYVDSDKNCKKPRDKR